ncbi:serine racemase [Apiospora saccharicola]|uniref:Serine racemase n=1 Tax=Apiospora saccharicola TaxID=335842 RepID=A0ABR1W3G1_9PEZI
MNQLTHDSIVQARDRLATSVTRTPCVVSRELGNRLRRNLGLYGSGAWPRVLVKLENLQIGGSFKYRGAMNALSQMEADDLAKGIVTYSSGNHARGVLEVAQAVSQLKNVEIPVHVVMPEGAAPEKLQAIRRFPAARLYVERGFGLEPCRLRAEALAQETGARLVASSDDPAVLAGHATIALELADQVRDEELSEMGGRRVDPRSLGHRGLDYLLVPCGGGGLLAGCLVALRGTGTRVLACEPLEGGGSQLRESLRRGERVPRDARVGPSSADGLRAEIGDASWAVIRASGMTADDVLQVSEGEVNDAVRMARDGLFDLEGSVEPSSAVPLAALLFSERFHGRLSREGEGEGELNVGVIITGGNIRAPREHMAFFHGH